MTSALLIVALPAMLRSQIRTRSGAYATALRDLGAPTKLTLMTRKQVGDDVISTFVVSYGSTEFDATLALAPDGKVAQFGLRRRQ